MTSIPIDLTDTYTAFERFLSLYEATEDDELKERAEELRARIRQCEEILTQLASHGMREELSALLSTLLEAWAEKEAVTLLIQSPITRPVVYESAVLQTRLARQYHLQSSRLLALLKEYEHTRATEQEQRHTRWQTVAQHAIEQQQEVLQQSQQANQQWAQVALTGIQQGQLGVQQYTQFAASVQEHVAKMLSASAQTQSELAQSMHARRRGGCLRTLVITAFSAICIVVLVYGLAYLGAMHLFSFK